MATSIKEIPEWINLILTKNLMCCSSVAGVILQAKVQAFEKVLWRVFCRNVFVRVKPLETPFEDPEHVSCCV
jgi:hypothetical protein